MTRTPRIVAAAALLCMASAASGAAQLPETASPVPREPRTSVIDVAPPTGAVEIDRASIVAAIERARPGDTIQFAPGTYLVGRLIPVATSRLTLQGHADGTVLRGCEPAEYDAMDREFVALLTAPPDPANPGAAWDVVSRCGMMEFTGGHVTVRNFTFEYGRLGLLLGCCSADFAFRATDGGYLIEDNTFRNSGNSVRAILSSPVPTVIRNNRFINTFHALSAVGSQLHFADNHVAVTDPAEVPGGMPGFGILIGSIPPDVSTDLAAGACDGNVIARNHVEGHPNGIFLNAGAGSACTGAEIRDNTIIVRRGPYRASWPYAPLFPLDHPSDSTIVGVPLTLWGESGAEVADGRVTDSLIEGNRIVGAEGVGVELRGATDNWIVNNTISGVVRRNPYPGNLDGPPPQWGEEHNGSGIWVSAGSEGNEITGNVFHDVASHTIVIEGDSDRGQNRSPGDAVRERGPIIDMHLHAAAIRSAAHADSVLEWMDRHGVVRALMLVHDTAGLGWRERAPDRFLVAVSFPCHEGRHPTMQPCLAESNGWPEPEWLRAQHAAGRLGALGELLNVYYGMAPADERLAPYFALAEELDIPVGVHTGRGPPAARRAPGCCPNFDDDFGNPALLEPVLRRHPELRVWLMHAGGAFLDEAIALMRAFPNVYADMSILNSMAPPAVEAHSLRAFLDAGLGDRIMLGTDNLPLERILERMDAFDFLSDAQRRAILYDNAARFLRLDAAAIARDHEQGEREGHSDE
jgi:uncharacterized protein